jgi:DNA-binding NtrC family response regulator
MQWHSASLNRVREAIITVIEGWWEHCMTAMAAFPIAFENGAALIATPRGPLREQVFQRLEGRWRRLESVQGGADALAKLEQGGWQVLFLDHHLPDLDSQELAAIIRQRFPEIQVVLLDCDVSLAQAGSGKDEGLDRLLRSWVHQTQSPELRPRVVEETETRRESENHGDEENSRCQPLPGMIGVCEAMQRVYRLAQLVAPRTTTVLVVGPTGSGKELVARALHRLSPREAKPFVAVNCAAIPESLLESELFGHARGAFTGAVQSQAGRITAAHGGTLFLDEIGELPLAMQAKLLRFLEEKEVQRLGTAELTRVDVRVIAASNVNIAERAMRGEFREDLFYRLAAFPLELPPLSERRDDIIPLAEHFLECMAAAMSMPCPRLSSGAAAILEAHPWPGNVRELQHVMERASILVEGGDTVLGEHLYFPFQPPARSSSAKVFSCGRRPS